MADQRLRVPEEAIEMYAARALGLTAPEIATMGRERVERWLAWGEGEALARRIEEGPIGDMS